VTVTNENQLWFQWERCEAGYDLAEDEHFGGVLVPKSHNFIPVFPLIEDPSLFGQFSELKVPEDFQRFANQYGLLEHRTEVSPTVGWVTAARSMAAAFRAWDQQNDISTLMEFFNYRSSDNAVRINVGTVRLRLELLPKRTTPILYMEPSTLLLAMWAQFAYTLTQNTHQKRCKNPKCEKWFSALTMRKDFCGTACKQAHHRLKDKGKGAI